jgi:hypothetical protein
VKTKKAKNKPKDHVTKMIVLDHPDDMPKRKKESRMHFRDDNRVL